MWGRADPGVLWKRLLEMSAVEVEILSKKGMLSLHTITQSGKEALFLPAGWAFCEKVLDCATDLFGYVSRGIVQGDQTGHQELSLLNGLLSAAGGNPRLSRSS
ncbi:unnamed protein product [Effrenium voratum]|nr:unnamed protein product [Effrenium voratum]